MPPQEMVNKALHRAYYLILLVLPLTGIAVFFDWTVSRLLNLLHASLFYLLMVLVLINILYTLVTKLKH